MARRMIAKYRGHLVKTTGDGILATFDGPGRAIRCALDFEAAAVQIGLPSRAGLHAAKWKSGTRISAGHRGSCGGARHGPFSPGRSSCFEGG